MNPSIITNGKITGTHRGKLNNSFSGCTRSLLAEEDILALLF
jgi:hypothetical protein